MNCALPNLLAAALSNLFDIDRFMPHGHCYLWEPSILWTSVISDALIAAAYITIPFTLVFQIMRKRKDLPFDWMFACFGVFIVACGFTHIMEIITVWKPHYAISSLVKAVTAAASVPTALILYRIAPTIVKFPTIDQLVNERTLRLKAEAASEAKDRFIAILSHELRTPLTPVSAGLDLLEDQLRRAPQDGASASARDTLHMIRSNLEVETVLIDDLLDLSALRGGKLKVELRRIDLAEVVAQSITAFRDEAQRKQITLEAETTASAIVNGAPVRLRQVIGNLLSNALKFTSAGGKVLVRLECRDGKARLSVSDDGRGIEAESVKEIFEPFEQRHRDRRETHAGLGLGLTIAKALTDAHGGRIWAESDGAGRGATFTVELPLATESADARSETSPQNDGDGARLLIVDDHADTLRTVALLLRKAGHTVETARSIREAEPLLTRTDVLISDIGLPDGSGCDLMMRFKAQHDGAGIAMSGFGQTNDFERSKRAGFSAHLVKPITIEKLRAAIAEVRAVKR